MFLEGKRIAIRRACQGDIPFLLKWGNDPANFSVSRNSYRLLSSADVQKLLDSGNLRSLAAQPPGTVT